MSSEAKGRRAGSRRSVPAAQGKPEPYEARRKHIAEARARYKDRPTRAEVVLEAREGGVVHIEAPHSDESGGAFELTDVFASTSNAWTTKSVLAIVNTAKTRGKDPTAEDVNAALAFIAAINPRDELESALAQQMFAAHDLAMTMAFSCKQSELRPAAQEYGNLATKMMRTFTAQIEALGKHRRGGVQEVRHTHTYIDARGSQNIIAETFHAGGAHHGNELATQPHGSSTSGVPMLGQDPPGHAVPARRDQREEAVPISRRA